MRRVVVVGGGYAGLAVARRLCCTPGRFDVTVVNPHAYMTYQPLLPEAAAGLVNPSHITVPLKSALRRARVLTASMTGLDPTAKRVQATAPDGSVHELPYDDLVLAVGSITRTFPVPGLVEHAIGFRTVEEAMHLANRVLSRLDHAESALCAQRRTRMLTFVFIGGGYAGVEALAEVEDLVRRTLPNYSGLRRDECRWVLVEAGPRILSQLPERLAIYATDHLRARGIQIRTGTRLLQVTDGVCHLSDGTTIESDTIVWTAGVVAPPLLRDLPLPLDEAGRVRADEQLRVPGVHAVWALGDCAAVPDIHTGGTCPPTAQHAVRQARRLAKNLAAAAAGRPGRPYRHRDAGAVASLGSGKGVAELYGMPLRGWPAWALHRMYHGSRLPNRRLRMMVNFGWLFHPLAAGRAALHALEDPREPLRAADRAQRRAG
ncbi:NAD(P)/FAD-dependent oxidoreductase [Dactylosporangium sucinum]|uniref:NADH dehydrogenase n=1 Tax=Dactylosporangium sucinum TaxID=1424081 RepID=A0A917TTP6_9ACTN|nr:NAD(P)/FAD-dependent oxidoreductase [Dactylosporangium sucinum]GGM36979.1 NADH dehydrogenase [Dactylosporangium sucinum]